MVMVANGNQQHLALLICYLAFSDSAEIGSKKIKSFGKVSVMLVKTLN